MELIEFGIIPHPSKHIWQCNLWTSTPLKLKPHYLFFWVEQRGSCFGDFRMQFYHLTQSTVQKEETYILFAFQSPDLHVPHTAVSLPLESTWMRLSQGGVGWWRRGDGWADGWVSVMSGVKVFHPTPLAAGAGCQPAAPHQAEKKLFKTSLD